MSEDAPIRATANSSEPGRDFAHVLAPIESLILKSEKARQKLSKQSWQHKMLCHNLAALYLARSLIRHETVPPASPTSRDESLAALTSMIAKTEAALPKFPFGTSQHTLLRNRINALREGEARIRAAQGG